MTKDFNGRVTASEVRDGFDVIMYTAAGVRLLATPRELFQTGDRGAAQLCDAALHEHAGTLCRSHCLCDRRELKNPAGEIAVSP
jgi:hypothetical protein